MYYDIVENEDREALVKEVQSKLDDDWRLAGGIALAQQSDGKVLYVQTLLKLHPIGTPNKE